MFTYYSSIGLDVKQFSVISLSWTVWRNFLTLVLKDLRTSNYYCAITISTYFVITISMKHLSIGYLSQAANPNTAGLKAAIISNIIHDFQYRLLMASDGGVYLKSVKQQ